MSSKIIIVLAALCAVASCKETNEQLIKRGEFLAESGKHKEAIVVYSEVLASNSSAQSAYYNRGISYMNTKEYFKALEDFQKVIQLKTPAGGDIVFTFNEQNSEFIEEAKFQVPYNDALYGRAQAKFFLDSIKSAYGDFQILIDNNYSEKVFCILYQADLWFKTGEDSTACEYVDWARRIAKTDKEIADCEEYRKDCKK